MAARSRAKAALLLPALVLGACRSELVPLLCAERSASPYCSSSGGSDGGAEAAPTDASADGSSLEAGSLEAGSLTTLWTGVHNNSGDLVCDEQNLYFVMGASPGRAVARLRKDGTALTTLTATSGGVYDARLALGGGRLFFLNTDAQTLMSVPREGGAATTLASLTNSVQALTADDSGVYYSLRPWGPITKLAVDGTPAWTIPTSGGAMRLVVGGSNLFWSEPTGVGRANTDGSGTFVVPLSSASLALAADGTNFYWYDLKSKSITRARHDGSAVTRLAFANAATLAADGTSIFFGISDSSGFGNVIGRMKTDGSGQQMMATIPKNPISFCDDAATLYVLSVGSGGSDGSIDAIAK